MKVLIYGNSAETLNQEREAGNHASLRNPELRYFNEKEPEPCDKIWADSDVILSAYESAYPDTERHRIDTPEAEIEEKDQNVDADTHGSRKKKRSKKAVNA